MEVGDAHGMFDLGCYYSNGAFGLPRNRAKAMELWQQAGELGNAASYFNIGTYFNIGEGVERDDKKADHYYELAAMGGCVNARHNLGCSEYEKSNYDRAIKHFMIAAGGGENDSAKSIQQLYMDGGATKDDYTNALREYQAYLDEIRSEQRDIAAAYSDKYKYY